ncbi:nucleoside 2-deoxyribosyltransferase [Lutibacter sp.]|uniref:nucleoside 2-deoxyribosyltransferase n=1 Tax=Lutibacter sp. TaxID=1925666 RepID=UPI0025BE2582|nr:nucleoside 2-deoxyribosyltransferase [Lutibacter sp.]MCF6182283.1 nucleoside 2-deoxyribosyltransferase [Lutibacter sp.]
MKKAYFAISYSNRYLFDKEIDIIQELFLKNNIELLVFVDKYKFSPNQEKEMMKVAFEEIDNSDFLIAELTTKSIGVGIEIGYAFAKNKPIFYLRKKDSKYSTTVSGCSTAIIPYRDEFDLKETMGEILKLK